MAATLLVKPDDINVKLASNTTSVFEVGLSGVSQQTLETSHPSRPPKQLLIISPTAKGEYPVIVFLHGFALSNSYYTDLLKHISSHGYIAVAPQLYSLTPTLPCWGYDEINSTAEVTDWLPKGLHSVLHEKVEADLLNLVLMGHSRGGKTAFSLAIDHCKTSLKFKALIGVDPVAGTSVGGQVKPEILTNHPHSLNVGYPIMIIGTGLGDEKLAGVLPECATKGLNHKNFYYESQPPCYHFVSKEYGHMDMLDDGIGIVGKLASCVCKSGKDSKDPMRRCVGGLVVAFLGYYLHGIVEDLEAILHNPNKVAPVTLDPVEYQMS
ncbi:Chlorophyllase [Thalictrum thalictroides]|uniref:Chlorophyllase n=1 Tax=Thalictrum thalictroides TaxID=46969 RepID=A0A7J6VCP9_THATH|nr:Chlorophyllase [Thalictrum thalictroides]